MSKNSLILGIVLASFLLGSAPAHCQEKASSQPTQREKFDPARDPAKDLAAAMERASKSGQRILLDVGGEWCSWCHKLDAFFQANNDVAAFLHQHFIVVKVNFSKENPNEKFLSQFPAIKGYPHLFVLGPDGKLLHSQNTGELESGDHHDHDKVFAFLEKWAPAAPHP
jgi:thiol:disulfide interchange protein